MTRPVSRAELARLAKVSGAAITKACKKQLAPACLNGGRVDLDHPATRAYLNSKGVTAPGPTRKAEPPPKPATKATASRRKREETEANAPETDEDRIRAALVRGEKPEDIEALASWTLRDFIDKFGSIRSANDWLDARKKIAEIREKDLKNEERDGTLIERELVKTHVFGAIEAANRRLLTDSPKTISRRLYALARSGADIEEAERVVREIVSSHLKPVKTSAARVLRNA